MERRWTEAEGASGGGAGAGGRETAHGVYLVLDISPFVAWVIVEARTSSWDPYVGVTNSMYDYTRFKVALYT